MPQSQSSEFIDLAETPVKMRLDVLELGERALLLSQSNVSRVVAGETIEG